MGGTLNFTGDTLHHTFAYTSADYASDTNTAGGLTRDYPNSRYSFSFSNTGNRSYSPGLILANAQSYPGTIPGLTNTSWSSGSLVIDATQSFTLTWNGFASDDGLSPRPMGQEIHLTIDPASGPAVFDQTLSSSATSFTLGSSIFTPGATYKAHLAFDDVYYTDTTQIPGATSATVYANRTNFLITAIPEPSTTAAALGLGMLAVALRKWRKRGTRVEPVPARER